ncbi:MAG: tRNA pseudouridine(55) synthase, partial [Oscillospiraceae bacterium]|nr:tRNA pseudouridine(55) synthase [Oscillospiraceae bacterium]
MSEARLCGILPLDKPPGWTSHDVVAKARGILGYRRIGHAGTLDPMATGLLILFVGKAARLTGLMPGDKTYQARLRLGYTSDTLDADGDVRPTGAAVPAPETLRAVMPRFRGANEQIPP